MGLSHSPRIVTDGLVFCVDAANPKSYPRVITISNNTGATISGTRDAYIWGSSSNSNFGTNTTWLIGQWGGSFDRRRGFLAFDGLSSIAPGIVTNAKIRLYVTAVNNNETFNIHRVTQSWVENQITWNNRSTGVAWSTAAGDFDATVITSKTIVSGNVGTYIEISGTGLTQLVQDWVNGTFANNGILIKSADETGEITISTSISAKEGTDGQRPELIFDYIGSGIGGPTWTDLSNNANTGALTNGPTYNSENGGSIVFDGTNDCIVVNSNASILSSTAYTKIAWFNTNNLSAANNIISGGNSGQHAFWLASGNKLQSGHNGSWGTVITTTSLSANTWYCGAVSFSTTFGWNLYLNGVLENTNASTTTFTGNGEILIGAFSTGGAVFSGRIATTQVYNRTLTATEIQQNFNALRGRYGL